MPVTVIRDGLNEAGLCRIKEDVADGFEYGDQIIGHFKTQRASWLFLKNLRLVKSPLRRWQVPQGQVRVLIQPSRHRRT